MMMQSNLPLDKSRYLPASHDVAPASAPLALVLPVLRRAARFGPSSRRATIASARARVARAGAPLGTIDTMLAMLSSSGARSASEPADAAGAYATWHVVAESCAVREAAEASARVVATLGRGGSLSVDERSSVPDRSAAAGAQPPLAAAVARRQCKGFLWLRVRGPTSGWSLASECCVGDYARLGAAWRYVVVCRDGAFVRRGLELASSHLYTLQRDAVFEVRERRVNEQGLARLRTDDGWISEDLNPLSGQRGPIASPLPVASPLTYRVVLRDGAVVRETVELSSAIVHVVPCGATVEVGDKQFSDHPAQHCVPRLRLTAPVHGWVSQRLNREPPDDLEVARSLVLLERHLGARPRRASGPRTV